MDKFVIIKSSILKAVLGTGLAGYDWRNCAQGLHCCSKHCDGLNCPQIFPKQIIEREALTLIESRCNGWKIPKQIQHSCAKCPGAEVIDLTNH